MVTRVERNTSSPLFLTEITSSLRYNPFSISRTAASIHKASQVGKSTCLLARRSGTPVPVGEEDSNSDEELPEEGKSEMYHSIV